MLIGPFSQVQHLWIPLQPGPWPLDPRAIRQSHSCLESMRRQGDCRVRWNGFGKGVPRIGKGVFECGCNHYCADLSIARDLDKEGIWRLGRIASSGSGSQGARAPGNAAQGSNEGVLSCLNRVCTLVPGEQSARIARSDFVPGGQGSGSSDRLEGSCRGGSVAR